MNTIRRSSGRAKATLLSLGLSALSPLAAAQQPFGSRFGGRFGGGGFRR